MIPVCEPYLAGRELKYVTDCVRSNWISSQGKYIGEFEQKFAQYCGTRHGVSTTSGTTALHLALAALGIGRDDEVIVPAFTMAASVFAILHAGATPVLVDCEPATWNMDVSQIENRLSAKTKAIMPVHIYGHPCDMDPIMETAGKRSLHVIEDAAEAHGAEYKGRRAGGIGAVGCFSFYANKIITTGEGGMLVTNLQDIAERARRLKDQAYSPEKRFLHTDVGFNYRMTNIQAAIGLAQLEQIDDLVQRRIQNAGLYDSLLKDVEGIRLPPRQHWAKNVYWMYSILVEDAFGMSRDDLSARLKEQGIDSRAFFIPMHHQPAFQNLGLFSGESYPVSEEISKRGMYLPSGSGLKAEQIEQVCAVLKRIRGHRSQGGSLRAGPTPAR
jgi:perosamine synthetase